ncbi:MAG: FHA domain-containing protein [Planctomycetota bacterium]|nr:FHA domain-containing protein [Planctomycetota bacterium]
MPKLVIQLGPGAGRDHMLGVGACMIGRDPSADFVLDDPVTSRQHFIVRGAGGTWTLEDQGSTNGTQLNGERVTRAALADGDQIRVGNTVLRYVQKDLFGGAQGAPVPQRRRRRAR